MKPRVSYRTIGLSLSLCVACMLGPVHRAYGSGLQDVTFEWLALRADIEEVQNATGNAFALRGGWSPTLHLTQSPVGLRLLAEYGALRTTTAQVFSVPSVQLLATWSPAEHLELALGAGAQFWVAPSAHDTRLIVGLEAHYVPHRRLWRVIRSGFAAVSIGASSGSGLQARLGVELRFRAEPAEVVPPAQSVFVMPASKDAPVPPLVCPPCPVCPKPPECPAAPESKTVVLPTPVLFAFDSAKVSVAGEAYLMQLGQGLAAQSDAWVNLALTGHANAVGKKGHNLILSVARARAVADVLERAGVAEHRMTIAGVGASQPIAGSAPDDASQQRVMLELMGGHVDARLQALIDSAALLPKEASP